MPHLHEMFDTFTRKYFRSQCTVINELSGDIHQEQDALLEEVNAARESAGLVPIERPYWWVERELD
jgi:hypothetical protein